MPINTEVRLGLELGADAPMELVSRVLSDINVICVFGGELQRHVTRSLALREVLRRDGPFLDDPELDYFIRRRGPYPGWPALALIEGLGWPALERQIAEWTVERRLDEDADARVRRVSYGSPLEIGLVVAGGGVILALLAMIRDWPARRRVNDAAASDYEDQVLARAQIRQAVVSALIDGRLPVRPELVDRLLTDDTARALTALTRANLSVQELPNAKASGRPEE